MALPKKIGDAVDALYATRADRLELQRAQEAELAKVKAKEAELEEHVARGWSPRGEKPHR
jgi:hypothetical protein